MKNVRSSQPCISMNFYTESVKHKFFPVCIVNMNLISDIYGGRKWSKQGYFCALVRFISFNDLVRIHFLYHIIFHSSF